jgi:hypothetical protein
MQTVMSKQDFASLGVSNDTKVFELQLFLNSPDRRSTDYLDLPNQAMGGLTDLNRKVFSQV